jgi:hypothetical protein
MDMDGVLGDKFSQERGGYKIMSKRGPKGEFPMYINSIPLSKIIVDV